MQNLTTTTLVELHAQWSPEELALYLEPVTTWIYVNTDTSCIKIAELIVEKRVTVCPKQRTDTMG